MCKANSTSTPFVMAADDKREDNDDEDDLEGFSLHLRGATGEKRKRHRLSHHQPFVDCDSPSANPSKSRRLRVSELNVSRYAEEFLELDTANKTRGKYGDVKIVRHRLDGMVYAVKITRNRFGGGSTNQERAVMNEIFAHAAIVKHKHIVRYN